MQQASLLWLTLQRQLWHKFREFDEKISPGWFSRGLFFAVLSEVPAMIRSCDQESAERIDSPMQPSGIPTPKFSATVAPSVPNED